MALTATPLESISGLEEDKMTVFPRSEILKTLVKLEALAGDLRTVMDGLGPDADTLAEAPLLEQWSIQPAPFKVLVGCN